MFGERQNSFLVIGSRIIRATDSLLVAFSAVVVSRDDYKRGA